MVHIGGVAVFPDMLISVPLDVSRDIDGWVIIFITTQPSIYGVIVYFLLCDEDQAIFFPY